MFTLKLRRRRWTLAYDGHAVGIFSTMGAAIAYRIALDLRNAA